MALSAGDIICFKKRNEHVTLMRTVKMASIRLRNLGLYETNSIRFPDDQWKKLYHETKTS